MPNWNDIYLKVISSLLFTISKLTVFSWTRVIDLETLNSCCLSIYNLSSLWGDWFRVFYRFFETYPGVHLIFPWRVLQCWNRTVCLRLIYTVCLKRIETLWHELYELIMANSCSTFKTNYDPLCVFLKI